MKIIFNRSEYKPLSFKQITFLFCKMVSKKLITLTAYLNQLIVM